LARGKSKTSVAPLAGMPPGIKARTTVAGLTLTDAKGRTLYVRDDGRGAAACDKACARDWQPFAAPVLATPGGLAGGWGLGSERRPAVGAARPAALPLPARRGGERRAGVRRRLRRDLAEPRGRVDAGGAGRRAADAAGGDRPEADGRPAALLVRPGDHRLRR